MGIGTAAPYGQQVMEDGVCAVLSLCWPDCCYPLIVAIAPAPVVFVTSHYACGAINDSRSYELRSKRG